ncbi:MAG: sulfotransferase [Alphaproteobacteria bacterium]
MAKAKKHLPRMRESLIAHAQSMLRSGEHEEALVAFGQLARQNPHIADFHYQQGKILFRMGKPEGALKAYDQALRCLPDDPEIFNAMGNCHYALGEGQKAAYYYGQVLKTRPHHAHALYNLTHLQEFAFDAQGVDLLRVAYENADAEEKVQLGFALGHVIEREGDIKQAFLYIQKANRLKQELLRYSPAADIAFMQGIARIFTRNFFESRQGWGSDDKTPIFIVGMPRCGSTLVEQILASHPQACGVGEAELMSPLALRILPELTGQPFPEAAGLLHKKDVRPQAAGYVRKLRARADGSHRVVDKMLNNYLYIGLIHLLLPEARIIHVKRDPMDMCWSIYRNYFPAGTYYAHDQQHLAAIYKSYESLMAHWQEVLPHVFMTLEYETLIAGPEQQTRTLLDYCGLPWDDACLNFHSTKRAVTTASAMQVRKPIYKTAKKSWAGLEAELEPLRKALQRN